MPIPDLLHDLRTDQKFIQNVVAWRTLPAQPADLAPIPPILDPHLHAALNARDIDQLYSHQTEAVERALSGHNLAIVTPTASGKTLCYNLPVLHTLSQEPDARALYLFPTKALAHDQLTELNQWGTEPPTTDHRLPITDHRPATYDGDTPSSARATIRKTSRIILTNPDMLHSGILPYHPNWEPFFANLRWIIIDEMHTYRGVFGSHVANVLRRLQRICTFYGSSPRFICTSATIANPQQLAERLIEQPVHLITKNGAPRGEKEIILYAPPIYDQERGLRRSATLEAQEIAARTILGGLQTIIFGRSRLVTEILLTYIRDRLARVPGNKLPADQIKSALAQSIRGYRGGYLPTERREIEAKLRDGSVRGVVATNALELGIDIGQLQAAILCGYPGSIAATWQQIGRAGRTQEASLALLVATGGLLDQYITRHPDYLFDSTPEHAMINPDNLMLLVDQIRCAAFELPFAAGDKFGNCQFVDDVLFLLEEDGDLTARNGRYFWAGDGYPARAIGLRRVGGDSIAIHATNDHEQADFSEEDAHAPTIIGEVDLPSAPMLLHEGAIYIHEGRTYRVQSLNLDDGTAFVSPAQIDYYTSATIEAEITPLSVADETQTGGATIRHGELEVSSQVTSYRRVKRHTHENLGTTPLDYPPQTLDTSGYWITLTPAAFDALIQADQWRDSPNDYGPNWQAQRKKVRDRDNNKCTRCGAPEPATRQHDVHHIVPFRTFGYIAGQNENYRQANQTSNLQLLCRTCHQIVEAGVRTRGGLDGLSYTLHQLAPLYLMCDRTDLGVSIERGEAPAETKPPGGGQQDVAQENPRPTTSRRLGSQDLLPAIYIYEQATAGLGFSQRLFEIHDELLTAAADLIRGCTCAHGCPACVGPVLENPDAMLETKELTLALLAALRGEDVENLEVKNEEKFDPIDDVEFM